MSDIEYKAWSKSIAARRQALRKTSLGVVSLERVAQLAGVSNTTVKTAESGKRVAPSTVAGINEALDQLEAMANAKPSNDVTSRVAELESRCGRLEQALLALTTYVHQGEPPAEGFGASSSAR